MAIMTSDSASSFAHVTSRWCEALRFDAIPEPVLGVARRAFLDTVAVAVAGRETRTVQIAETLVEPQPLLPLCSATCWGGSRMSAPDAAYCNAVAAHALRRCDDNLRGIFNHFFVSI